MYFHIENYLRKRRLSIRPDVIPSIISKYSQFVDNMIKVKVNKKIISVDKCIHCINLKSKNIDAMCKKHTALFDYDNFIKKGAVFNYNNKKFILFSNYALTIMNNEEGYFVICFSKSYLKQGGFTVFAINKELFKDIDNLKLKDITSDILKEKFIVFFNTFILDVTNGKIEKIS